MSEAAEQGALFAAPTPQSEKQIIIEDLKGYLCDLHERVKQYKRELINAEQEIEETERELVEAVKGTRGHIGRTPVP